MVKPLLEKSGRSHAHLKSSLHRRPSQIGKVNSVSINRSLTKRTDLPKAENAYSSIAQPQEANRELLAFKTINEINSKLFNAKQGKSRAIIGIPSKNGSNVAGSNSSFCNESIGDIPKYKVTRKRSSRFAYSDLKAYLRIIKEW